MSLELIDHKKTKLIDINGNKVWVNEDCNIGINQCTGELISTDTRPRTLTKYGYPIKSQNKKSDQFTIMIHSSNSKYSFPYRYETIVSSMFLGTTVGAYRFLKLKNKDGNYDPTNVEFSSKSKSDKRTLKPRVDFISRTYSNKSDQQSDQQSELQLDQKEKFTPLFEHEVENVDGKKIIESGLELKVNVHTFGYVTRDGRRFTKDQLNLAKDHQANVLSSLDIANVVIENGGGYALAESVFLKALNDKRYYKNFREVIKSNTIALKEESGTKIQIDTSPIQFDHTEIQKALKKHQFTSYDVAKNVANKLSIINESFNSILDELTK